MAGETRAFEMVEGGDAMDLVPGWEVEGWWFLVVGLGLLGVAGYVRYWRYWRYWRGRRSFSEDAGRERREAYRLAVAELSEGGGGGVREDARVVSLALRGYLARSMGEPALYETHEEFIGRHEALQGLPEVVRVEVGEFFERLAGWKYGREDVAVEGGLRGEGKALLGRMHEV